MSEFAAIDLGAESGRVVRGRLAGGRVTLEVAHRFENRPLRLPDGLLIGYLETEDFETALAGMEATDVNARWQAAMSEFLVPPLRRIEEVFHLD